MSPSAKEAEVGFGTTRRTAASSTAAITPIPALKGRLEWQGNRLWEALCAELGFGFARVGELTVALEAEQLPQLDKLLDHARQQGIPGLEHWPPRTGPGRGAALNPSLLAAIYAPATGVVNPYEACYALAENAVANGLVARYKKPRHRWRPMARYGLSPRRIAPFIPVLSSTRPGSTPM